VVAEVYVDERVRVERLMIPADIGTIVNPDGALNQIGGGAIQASSWTTLEQVRFDRNGVDAATWENYPILRFSSVPIVNTILIPGNADVMGAGELAQGPAAGPIANAGTHALGLHVRSSPLTFDNIVAAIG
jgi:nicotinate dehydrogenase subunit B